MSTHGTGEQMHDASTQEANDVSSKITDKSNIETLAA